MAFLNRFCDSFSRMFYFTFPRCTKFLTFAFIIYVLDFIPSAEAAGCGGNVTEKPCTREATECSDGLILPKWEPNGDLGTGDKAARAIVYFATMVYLFLGVSIISDRFMSSIEVITSKEKEVVVKKPSGQTTVVSVRIWNETVSNLTLMALGSSAPEILLSVIEVCGNKFEAGQLGPSTIVGSAAFNLFVISAICIFCLPEGEVRRIKHLRVFFITASWSVFAYLWLYFILSVSSCGVVDLWEGILTFFFFPLTVLSAYVVDKKFFPYKFLSKKYRSSRHAGMVVTVDTDAELADGKISHPDDVAFRGAEGGDEEVKEFEKHRKEFMEILKDLRRKNPNIDMKSLEEMAEFEAINRGPKSRAFYRIQATRKLTGSGNVIKKQKIEKKSSLQDIKMEIKEDDTITRVFFDPGHYTVMENIGTFYLTVTREGGDLEKTLYVDYKTEDGSANSGSDFEYTEGTLVFHPLEVHKQFSVTIIDDDIFEEDEHFYVKLENLRVGDAEGLFESDEYSETLAVLSPPFMATVMILDDDHPGIFHFEEPEMTITESIGEVEITLVRSSGARGSVKVPFHYIDGSAKSGKDYSLVEDHVIFNNDETMKTVRVKIVDDEEYEKSEVFYLQLDEPFIVKGKGAGKDADKDSGTEPNMLNEEEMRLAELGKPRLGDHEKLAVHIKESYEFKNVVDKLLKKANVSLVVGTSSWREQFIEAISVSAGGEEDEEAEEKLPSCLDYVMHFLTLFWKIMFAFVPPTDYWGGWACFIVSILMIGLLTAFIGDVASHFGCTIGLKDAVTAISFVALGTSVPDTFASKTATLNDRYADSSIGNVTGSNAVNVFLGIGIAWTVAAIYQNLNGKDFVVDPGTLAFSVTVFCCLAVVALGTLLLRRHFAGGELGGKKPSKQLTACFFFSLWVIYIVMSSMVYYCYIPGF